MASFENLVERRWHATEKIKALKNELAELYEVELPTHPYFKQPDEFHSQVRNLEITADDLEVIAAGARGARSAVVVVTDPIVDPAVVEATSHSWLDSLDEAVEAVGGVNVTPELTKAEKAAAKKAAQHK